MSVTRKTYRVDNRYDFTMEFRRESNGTFTIWAVSWPKNRFTNDEVTTHVNPQTGRICVTIGREPRTLDRAVAIAQVWMKGYAQYCVTGVFPNSGGRVNVN